MSDHRVIINDERGKAGIEMILAILAAIIIGFVVCGLAPGIFITSIIDWFVGLQAKTAWGFSIVNSILMYILCRKYSHHFTNLGATISYAILAVSAAFLIFLSVLFFDAPFPARTLVRMFGKSVDDKYETSPGEKRRQKKEYQSSIENHIESEKRTISEMEREISALNTETQPVIIELNKSQLEELNTKLSQSKEALNFYESKLDSLNLGLDVQATYYSPAEEMVK